MQLPFGQYGNGKVLENDCWPCIQVIIQRKDTKKAKTLKLEALMFEAICFSGQEVSIFLAKVTIFQSPLIRLVNFLINLLFHWFVDLSRGDEVSRPSSVLSMKDVTISIIKATPERITDRWMVYSNIAVSFFERLPPKSEHILCLSVKQYFNFTI